mgnify:CR=1 FL=1
MDGEPDVVRGGVGGEEPQQAQPFDQVVHGVEWRHRSPRQQELAGEGGSVEGPQAQHVVAHGVIMADGPDRGWRRYTVTDSDATYPSSTLPVMVASCSETPSLNTLSDSSDVRAMLLTLWA